MVRLLTVCIIIVCSCLNLAAQPICKVTRYDDIQGQPLWHITQILQDRQGLIWMATWNGLIRFDGYEMKCFKSQPGDGCELPSDRVRNIRMTEDGNILCRFDGGSFLFDTRTYRFSRVDEELPTRGGSVFLKREGSYNHTDAYATEWTIHGDGRLEYKDVETGKNVEYRLDEPLGDARCCLSDRQGNLWVLGLFSLSKLSFAQRPVDVVDLKSQVEVRSLLVDSQKRYWIAGSDDASLALFDKENRPLGYLTRSGQLSRQYASFGARVYTMKQTADGTIWMGCKPQGLYRLKEKAAGSFSVEHIDSLSGVGIYDITEDAQGRLWLATLGHGIACISNPSVAVPQLITADDGFPNYPKDLCRKTRCIHFAADGTLLAATTEGLLVGWMDGEEMAFRVHTREADRANSLSCSATMDIASDAFGRLFVATESGGVNMIVSGSLRADHLDFRHFNMTNGMPSDITLSLTALDDKIMVMSSNAIVELDADSGRIDMFDSHFLRIPCRFSDAHPVMLPDGRWLFGMQFGAFAVHPSSLKRSEFVPEIALADILVQNEHHIHAANGMDTLTLSPNGRNVTIHFAALDFTDVESLSYAFRLDDNETDGAWNNIGHNNSVTFLDLMPGEYELQIRSTNADGVWVDNVRSLKIIVTPKFTETKTATCLFVLVVLLAVGAIVYTVVYIRRIHRKQRETLEAYLSLLNNSNDDVQTPSNVTEVPLNVKVNTDDDRLMKRITAFVEQHISDADITISDMADAAAISRSGLQRKVKQLFGITPLDFLREARIKRATHLLETTDKTISEIAFVCGFSDPKYFSRTFKTSKGMTPKEYRDNQE